MQEAVGRAHAEELIWKEKIGIETSSNRTIGNYRDGEQRGRNTEASDHKIWSHAARLGAFSFWGQFETQIDKSSTAEVTKFSYFKELMDLKVRNPIDGLSFTPESQDG